MKIPNKIYVALHYSQSGINGYLVVADKEQTKYYQNNKAKADRNSTGGKHQYIDNTAKDGFRIEGFTFEGTYKVWHPDGFTFFVTPRNLYDLIRTSTVINGEVQNKLYFDKDLNLISEVSEILQSTLEEEEKNKNIKDKVKELKFNDKFMLEGYNANEYIYFGRYHVLQASFRENNTVPNQRSKLTHVVYNLNSSKYQLFDTIGSLSLTNDIKQSAHFTKSEDEVLEDIKQYFKDMATSQYNVQYNVISISKKVMKNSDVRLRFIECNLEDLNFKTELPCVTAIELEDGTHEMCSSLYLKNTTTNRYGYGYNSCSYQNTNYETLIKNGLTQCLFKLYSLYEVDGLIKPTNYGVYYTNSSEPFITLDILNHNYKFGYIEYYV